MTGQANVLIDNYNRPVVADFGLTFVIDHGEFTTNKIAGPARWTAPEVLDPPGEEENEPPYSQASDVFAFGMTMIEVRRCSTFIVIRPREFILQYRFLRASPRTARFAMIVLSSFEF